MIIRTRVRHGRIQLDEPCDLPDDAEVDVHVAAAGSRDRVVAAIEAGLADEAAGRVVSHEEVRRRLERKFGPFPA